MGFWDYFNAIVKDSFERTREESEIERREHLERHESGRVITGVSYVPHRSQLADGRKYIGKRGYWKVYWHFKDGCFGGSFHIGRNKVLYYKAVKIVHRFYYSNFYENGSD